MGAWKAIEIPHSDKVITGQRVAFWQRPDWTGSDRYWVALAPLLVFGGLGWLLWMVRHGGGDTIGATLRGGFFALLAIAFGVGALYATFIADRSITAACPVCAHSQRWTPSATAIPCFQCHAEIEVKDDNTLREVGLDATGRYLLDTIDLEGAIGEHGEVSLVMPAICAVCGAEPTTTAKIKVEDEASDDSAKDEARTRRELAALAVPLCAQHADQTPVALSGSYVMFLTFASYRYYRAFLLGNPAGKKARAAAAGVAASAVVAKPRATPGQLEPLLCPSCGAPLPVGEGDDARCVGCGHVTALPEPYKQLRDAKRMSDRDAAQLASLASEIARPPPPWKRVSMIVGYAVGGATVVVMAIGAVIGAVIGVVAGSPLGDTAAQVLAAVGAITFGLVAVPYMGEWVAAVAVLHHTSAATDLVVGAAPVFRYDMIAAAILYGLGVVPIALAWRTQGNLSRITSLQGKLAAQRSPDASGGLCCRHCGAALDLAPDAVLSRCIYCGADNLVTVPASLAARHASDAKDLDAKVHDAVASYARDRDNDRTTMLTILGLGLLLLPFLCLAGYVLHTYFIG